MASLFRALACFSTNDSVLFPQAAAKDDDALLTPEAAAECPDEAIYPGRCGRLGK